MLSQSEIEEISLESLHSVIAWDATCMYSLCASTRAESTALHLHTEIMSDITPAELVSLVS